MLGLDARKCTLCAVPRTRRPYGDANSEKRVCISWRIDRRGILENLYRFMPAISGRAERGVKGRERERRLVSETSVWSPLTASPSSIYYKDRAASRDALSIRREAGFDGSNGRWYNSASSIASFISYSCPFPKLSSPFHRQSLLRTEIIRRRPIRPLLAGRFDTRKNRNCNAAPSLRLAFHQASKVSRVQIMFHPFTLCSSASHQSNRCRWKVFDYGGFMCTSAVSWMSGYRIKFRVIFATAGTCDFTFFSASMVAGCLFDSEMNRDVNFYWLTPRNTSSVGWLEYSIWCSNS